MSSAEDMSCFSITWEIENYSLLLESDENMLRSPAWKIDTTEEFSWWRLRAYYSVSSIVFELFKLIGSTVLDQCQLFLITSCGQIPLQAYNSGLDFFIERNSIIGNNGKSVFPNNTLTVCGKMWKKTLKAGEYHHNSVLHKLNYSWDNKKENSEAPNYTFFEKNNFLLYIHVKRKPEKGTHTIIIGSVPRRENSVSIVGCNLSINDGLGSVVNKQCIYPHVSWSCEIENFKEENEDSGFQFQLDCIIAVHKNHIPQFFSSKSSLLDSSGILSSDLLQIYKEETFSDAILTSEEKSFSVHRSILAARSPVFSAMFKKERMIEGREGVVVIDDVDSATLGRMLVFLYGDSLEEMDWKETTALYYAADKYAVLYLKQKCGDVLKAGLALDNACQALVLADQHSDQELMKCTIDFIRDHQEVIASAEWEKFEESNGKLAAKTLREVFVKK